MRLAELAKASKKLSNLSAKDLEVFIFYIYIYLYLHMNVFHVYVLTIYVVTLHICNIIKSDFCCNIFFNIFFIVFKSISSVSFLTSISLSISMFLQAVDRLSKGIIAKLLHGPMNHLRHQTEGDATRAAINQLQQAFQL